jgi:DNA-binding NarL/FixJ family response regulator
MIIGPTIADDDKFKQAILPYAEVYTKQNFANIPGFIQSNACELLILEFPESFENELQVISEIRQMRPSADIILLTDSGDKEMIAKALNYGVRDIFRSPYNHELITERVIGLLKYGGASAM